MDLADTTRRGSLQLSWPVGASSKEYPPAVRLAPQGTNRTRRPGDHSWLLGYPKTQPACTWSRVQSSSKRLGKEGKERQGAKTCACCSSQGSRAGVLLTAPAIGRGDTLRGAQVHVLRAGVHHARVKRRIRICSNGKRQGPSQTPLGRDRAQQGWCILGGARAASMPAAAETLPPCPPAGESTRPSLHALSRKLSGSRCQKPPPASRGLLGRSQESRLVG